MSILKSLLLNEKLEHEQFFSINFKGGKFWFILTKLNAQIFWLDENYTIEQLKYIYIISNNWKLKKSSAFA